MTEIDSDKQWLLDCKNSEKIKVKIHIVIPKVIFIVCSRYLCHVFECSEVKNT